MPEKKMLCFVISPIGAENSKLRKDADWLLDEIIVPVVNEFSGFFVKRADKENRPGQVDAQLINDLHEAELVIADLTGQNPNVFYEVGIRHMVMRPIIHMRRRGTKAPFDLAHCRVIDFSTNTSQDLQKARDALKAQIQAAMAPNYQAENPVTTARARQHGLITTPEFKPTAEFSALPTIWAGSARASTAEMYYRYCVQFESEADLAPAAAAVQAILRVATRNFGKELIFEIPVVRGHPAILIDFLRSFPGFKGHIAQAFR